MRVLFLAPDTHEYNHEFVRALAQCGARVVGVGPNTKSKLRAGVLRHLADYRSGNALDAKAMLEVVKPLGNFDRIETIDEPLVEVAAELREQLGIPGLRPDTARLCRDKVAMKQFLRNAGVPCAQSIGATSAAEALAFAEREGYPVIAKPVAGFGSLRTYRCANQQELAQALADLQPTATQPIAIEEFIVGHEGFFDSICGSEGLRHEFAAHYFPGCLEANQQRWISPQIAVTNRIAESGYQELRTMGKQVITALGLTQTATHMEWFFGPKGLKFSELGARPAGEKIWDMYRVGNECDVFKEWALAVLGRKGEQKLTRRFAVGSVQIRPSCDGKIVGHRGLDAAHKRCGAQIYEQSVPKAGTATLGLDRGWLVNTWFRLKHTDYDQLRELMSFLGDTVKVDAR